MNLLSGSALAAQERAEIDHIVNTRLRLREGCGSVAQRSNTAAGHGPPGLFFECRLARCPRLDLQSSTNVWGRQAGTACLSEFPSAPCRARRPWLLQPWRQYRWRQPLGPCLRRWLTGLRVVIGRLESTARAIGSASLRWALALPQSCWYGRPQD